MKIYLPIMLLFVGNMLIASGSETTPTINNRNYDANYKKFFSDQHTEAFKRLSKQSQSKDRTEKADADDLLKILHNCKTHRESNEENMEKLVGGSNQPS